MVYPTSYFPPVHLLGLQLMDPSLVIEQHEHFIKQTHRSRCTVLGPNGPMTLSVPVHWRSKTSIHEVRIDHSCDWVRDHERTLISGYNSAPYFEHYIDDIRSIWSTKHEYLIDLNRSTWSFFCTQLQYTDSYERSTAFQPYSEHDIRTASSTPSLPTYRQVFQERFGFVNGLSALDLIFNLGKESILYIEHELNPSLRPMFTIFDSNQARINEHNDN